MITEADVLRARKVARGFARRSNTRWMADEWESAALFGLGQAAVAYGEEREVAFWTFAFPRVSGACVDALRKWTPYGYGRNSGKPPNVLSLGYKYNDRYTLAHDLPEDGFPVGWELEWSDKPRKEPSNDSDFARILIGDGVIDIGCVPHSRRVAKRRGWRTPSQRKYRNRR